MAQYRKVGNKEQIQALNQERTSWQALIKNIADMEETELDTWFTNHFGTLSGDMRTGMEMIVKALWANIKISKRLWRQTTG